MNLVSMWAKSRNRKVRVLKGATMVEVTEGRKVPQIITNGGDTSLEVADPNTPIDGVYEVRMGSATWTVEAQWVQEYR